MRSKYATLVLQNPVKRVDANGAVFDDYLARPRACIWCIADFERYRLLGSESMLLGFWEPFWEVWTEYFKRILNEAQKIATKYGMCHKKFEG